MHKKEFQIGKIFQFGLVKLQCVKGSNDCEGCYLNSRDCCSHRSGEYVGPCLADNREDKTDVIFTEVKD